MDFNLDHQEEEYLRELINRFEESLSTGQYIFLDTEELEDIIQYYFSRPDFKSAEAAIQLALTRYPTDEVFLIYKAQNLNYTNQPEKALELLVSLEEKGMENADIHLTKAAIYSSQKEHQSAIREYQKAMKQTRENRGELYAEIAFEYESISQFDTASDYLMKAYRTMPLDESLLYEIGYCCDLAGLHDKAVQFFESVLDESPYNYVAWFNLGLVYSAMELFEKAIEAFEYAIAIEPKFIPAYYSKANVLESMELFAQAIVTYKQIFDYEQPEAIALYYIADCYEKLKQFEKAIDFYRQALEKEPELPDAWMGLGICLHELNDNTEALQVMKHSLEIEPENHEYWYILADTQLEIGQVEESLPSFQKVSQLNPYSVDIWLDLSDLYFQKFDDLENAMAVLEDGIAYQPDSPELAYRKVAFLLEENRVQEAITRLHELLAKDPGGAKVFFEYSKKAQHNPEIIEMMNQVMGEENGTR